MTTPTRELLIMLSSHMAYMQGQLEAFTQQSDPEDFYWYRESVALRQKVIDALAEDGPAVVNGEPSDEEGPSAEEVEELCEEHGFIVEGCESIECLQGLINEAIARWGRPAPVLAGEVGELVAWLRNMSEAGLGGLDELKAGRAADLLEQRQAAPVPVASDVYFEFVVSDADYCTQAGGIAPSYAQALSEGQHYLAQYQQAGPHTLEVRRVEVLPLPSGEVEA